MVAGEIIGWRAWKVETLGKLIRLGSVTHTAHWPVSDYVYATCGGSSECSQSSDGKCPGEDCSCGLYTARDRDHLLHDLSYADYVHYSPNVKRVIGEVALSGKVIVGTQGWKAEKARIFKIYVPHLDWKLGKRISEQYGVPYELARWI